MPGPGPVSATVSDPALPTPDVDHYRNGSWRQRQRKLFAGT